MGTEFGLHNLTRNPHFSRRMSRHNGKDFEETLNWDSSVSSKEAL